MLAATAHVVLQAKVAAPRLSAVELCFGPAGASLLYVLQTASYSNGVIPGSAVWTFKKSVQLPVAYANGVINMFNGDTAVGLPARAGRGAQHHKPAHTNRSRWLTVLAGWCPGCCMDADSGQDRHGCNVSGRGVRADHHQQQPCTVAGSFQHHQRSQRRPGGHHHVRRRRALPGKACQTLRLLFGAVFALHACCSHGLLCCRCLRAPAQCAGMLFSTCSRWAPATTQCRRLSTCNLRGRRLPARCQPLLNSRCVPCRCCQAP